MTGLYKWKQEVEQLSSLKGNYTPGVVQQKIKLLERLVFCPFINTTLFKTYHESLLFLCSQPDNSRVYQLAQEGLEKIKTIIEKKIKRYPSSKHASLNGTGIYGTELVCSFSYEIARWLSDNFGNDVSLHSNNSNTEQVSKILGLFLPGMEYQEITQTNCNLQQRVQKLTGKKNKTASLRWLLDTMKADTKKETLRNVLYEQLQVYIRWKLKQPFYSRTFLRSLPQKTVYQEEAAPVIKNYKAFVRKKIKPPVILTPADQFLLLNVARTSLALLYSETDPVTFGDIKTVKYFNLENGISIALYTMEPSKRFTIESYIGYMAFKNSVPVAYGGGWLFGERCKIGINIYPAFRAGNSALLFASILGLYHQYLGAKRFVVKPYQFGKNNPDGLRSGAFWFYYKLGFRPTDEILQNIATVEQYKKQTIPKYKTPLKILKQFTGSPVELVLDKKAFPSFDASIVSKFITHYAINNFAGNRQDARQYCAKKLINIVRKTLPKKLTPYQLEILNSQAAWFAVLFASNEKAAGWTATEIQQLTRLLLSKYEADEINYVNYLRQHKKLWQVLNASFGKSIK
ncbi:MAG: hypothetical protein ABI666_12590 [Ferruginibacter sp.]